MGSSISRIYDDYDDYEWLCEQAGIPQDQVLPIRSEGKKNFYTHAEEICASLNELPLVQQQKIKNSYVYNNLK